MKDNNITRRDFLKTAGIAAAAATVAACTSKGKAGSSQTDGLGEMTLRKNNKGEDIAILGYGCMRWPTFPPDENGQKEIDQEAVNAMVDYAIEHGVTYFDTAPIYLQGKSEAATGLALKRHPRESFTIATKLSTQRGEPTRERSLKMYYASFENLQVDYIDYYLLHSIGGGDDPMAKLKERFFDNGVLDFLVEERKAGHIRNLGWSFHGDVRVFDYMLSLHDQGKYIWDFVQIQMNYIDWKNAHTRDEEEVNAEYMYNELAKRGIPVVIMEPLLGGALAHINDHFAEQLLTREPQKSIASWAFRFCGTHPGVMCVLSGMTYMENLVDNVSTYSPLKPLNEEELAILEDIAQEYVKYPLIPCTACQYCMPCPYGINIPAVFAHYNKCLNEGFINEDTQSEQYRKARRAYLISLDRNVETIRQANHCIGCGQCISSCPQHIAIPSQMRRIDIYTEKLKRNG
ncbi:MAG: aldo/keto reductase [Bacteroidales bacterium]|nr:aldo/keto reductase [Candidatus Cacconaster merdequi]